jgi:hypothetical protein
MSAENAFPVDAARRRRRRTAILLMLIGALLASAFAADRLFRSNLPGATAWTSDTIFPRMTEYFAPRHGVTIPIGRKQVRSYTGQGGPEDPGAYIEEDDTVLTGAHDPIGIAGDSASLPTGRLGASNRFGPGDGGPLGGGSGGGGGPGGGIVSCEKSDEGAKTLAEIDKLCPGDKPDAKADTPGSVVTDTSGELAGGGGGSGPTQTLPGSPAMPEIVGPGAPQLPAQVTVSAVPEPQSWLTMIAGFLMIGLAIRHRGRRTVGRTREA